MEFSFGLVRNMVSHPKGRTLTAGVSNQGAEKNICTEERGSNKILEKSG
jgi:hypothetical protein